MVAPLDLVTAVFGPRYTFASRSKRFSVFRKALGGEADGFHRGFDTRFRVHPPPSVSAALE
jgi:hypothetical protein